MNKLHVLLIETSFLMNKKIETLINATGLR